ncbi:hypothetical protein [Streptomyces sp. NPDC096030]|uniref:hypothetical protein n=1 Tax=Streptomyces sp. NPDC096030 TaxID=3155423 RepID=UPI0033189F20
MTTRTLRYAPPPGPDQLHRIAVVPWIDRSSATGPYCRLLLAHDPPQTGEPLENIEHIMLGLAAGLRLAPAQEGSRYVGPLLYMRRGATTVGGFDQERILHVPGRSVVVLNYGHEDCVLRVPDGGPDWSAMAARLTHVQIAVGLDPHSAAAGDDAVSYLRRSRDLGRLWVGIAGVRT